MSATPEPIETRPVRKRKPLYDSPFRFIKPTLPPLAKVMKTYEPVYADGTLTNASVVSRFEQAAAEWIGVRHCVAVSSCTSGLMLVLRALNISREVIVPSFTFFATAHSVVWNGCRPVFADCDVRTWNVDVKDVERRITDETEAIVAVHLYGNPCNIGALTDIATRRGLKLIFDAAHAFGSKYGGRRIGQFGDAEVFSFSPTKLLVAGEGGLVTTNDATLAQRIRAARNYGDLGAYDPEMIGLNARMSEYNAALALAGLDMVDAKVRRHHQIAGLYDSLLAGLPGVSFQSINPSDVTTYKDYSIHVDATRFGMTRDELASVLRADNIETKKYFYPPVHQQTLYRKYSPAGSNSLPMTELVANGILSLPIYESLADDDVEKMSSAIRSSIQDSRVSGLHSRASR
jgi:dTDP-4-amino-4,6-dideoxygalactose transaminase